MLLITIMSGAAGLSAAKRRRGLQSSTSSENEYITTRGKEEPQPKKVSPLQVLHIHEHKLEGLLNQIQTLNKVFVEHREEVVVAIPELQQAVEELIKNIHLRDSQNLPTINETEADSNNSMQDIVNELSERLVAETTSRVKLEAKMAELVNEHAATRNILTETGHALAKLEKELNDNKKKPSKVKKDKEPTFTTKSDADIVKAALSKTEDNIALETTEKED